VCKGTDLQREGKRKGNEYYVTSCGADGIGCCVTHLCGWILMDDISDMLIDF